jgi:hypothetical protein
MDKATQRTGLNDPLTQDAVVELLENCIPVKTICQSLGIPRSSYYERRSRDPGFAEETDRARAVGIKALIGRILDASEKDWRAALALLRLMIPNRDWEDEPMPMVTTTKVSEPPRLLSDAEAAKLLEEVAAANNTTTSKW